MEIDPYRQFWLLFGAPLAGFLLGGVWELFHLSRVFLGAYRAPDAMHALYARPLPLLKHPVPLRERSVHRMWRGAVIAFEDCLFCILFVGILCVMLYCLNDGQMRVSVPVLALCGFAAFRVLFARYLDVIRSYLAYGCAACACYIRALVCLPVRSLKKLLYMFVFRPVRALFVILERKARQKRSARLCRWQLELAHSGLVYGEKEKTR